MKARNILLLLGVIFVIAGATFGSWKFVSHRADSFCAACQRPIHEHARTVASVGGEKMSYCCPACALSEHRQSGKPVEVLTLTDQETGKHISPKQAYIVRGSDVNSCSGHSAHIGLDKRPLATQFDRCSPSMLAFASAASAARFANEHGGEVIPFEKLAAEYR